MNKPLWIEEFGEAFAIPAWVTNKHGVEDVSWHNDMCPSFEYHAQDGRVYRMYVDHPVIEERDSNDGMHSTERFSIITETEDGEYITTALSTSDEAAARTYWTNL